MGGETMFRDLYDKRITENTEGLTQQVQTVDKKVEELGIKIDKMDVKFEELKHLILGFQNQGSTAVKLESGETSKKRNRPTCIEEVHNRRPTGREEQGDIRCLSLERGAESLEFLCKYHTLDVKFEELKQLIMGFQNQGKTAVKLESDETSTKRKRSTCIEEVHNRRPTGREEQGDIRCLALQRGAESLEFLCKYHTLGCPEILSNYNKLKHEAVCSFRPYSCPYAGSECAVIGDIPFLVSHLRDDHKVDMHTGCTFHHRYVKSNPREVTNATWMLTVFHCFGQYFCLHFEAFVLGVTPVYMAFLRLMGDEADARNYSYSLEVGGNGRKLIWEGIPRSIRDSHQKVRDSLDGLIIQRNMALFFSGGDKKELKLRVAGRIWKREQNSEAGVCTSKNLCI